MSEPKSPLNGSAGVERRGLRDRVYDLVLDMLMRSNIEPGTRLSIDAVARDLQVSPTPVREALVQLERTGLVTREPLKGYRVAAPIAEDQLEALFDARLVLEGGATALAAQHATTMIPLLEAALNAQRTSAERLRAAASMGGLTVDLLRDYFEVDWNFHRVIFQGAHNPFLLDMSEAISTRVHRMRQTLLSGTSDADQALIEHADIIEGFKTCDSQKASNSMCAHIEKVRTRSRSDASH